MLKKLELHDAYDLHAFLVDPLVYPYVRYKATRLEEYLFLTRHVIEQEERGELLMRVILDENGKAIGQIALYDMIGKSGFLGTWLGVPYHGKGYNRIAKETFFHEVFYEMDMESIFMKIRKTNIKSRKAAEKLPYAEDITLTKPHITAVVNGQESIYDVFEIRKEIYEQYMPQMKEA